MSSHSRPATRPGGGDAMAYVGYCVACGALVSATVDEPQYKRETAKWVAGMVRDGLRVERVTCQTVRETMAMCSCTPNPRKRAKATAAQAVLGV